MKGKKRAYQAVPSDQVPPLCLSCPNLIIYDEIVKGNPIRVAKCRKTKILPVDSISECQFFRS